MKKVQFHTSGGSDYYIMNDFKISTVDSNGFLHSFDDKPALIWKNSLEINDIWFVEWFKHGKTHREGNKPARIEYFNYEKNNISHKYYYYENELHNFEGPAVIDYNTDHSLEASSYFIFNKMIDSRDEFEIYVNRLEMLNEI